jgi:protein-disulfide isomerase
MQQIQGLPPQQQFGEIAKIAGFQDWAAMRGLPADKTAACLANQAEVDRLVQMQNDAISSYEIPGTPSFLLNGELVKIEAGSTPWRQLEAKIKSALGG